MKVAKGQSMFGNCIKHGNSLTTAPITMTNETKEEISSRSKLKFEIVITTPADRSIKMNKLASDVPTSNIKSCTVLHWAGGNYTL